VKRGAIIFLIAARMAMGMPSYVGPSSSILQPSVYGDSRYGSLRSKTMTNIMFSVSLPEGEHEAFTVVAWMRAISTNGISFLTTQAFWCPDKIQYTNPDLLAGVGGHDTAGTNLTDVGGSITVASFPWQPYAFPEDTNDWPKGVYTIAGWASNEVTVSLGGTDYVVGPGEFNRNALPGPADSVVISGTGLVAIGISQTPCNEYFNEMDGVTTNGLGFTPESVVSNEISMVTWRFKIVGTNQIYRSDIGRISAFNELSQIKSNPCARATFSSGGIYRVGLIGVVSSPPFDVELFDYRVLPWYLTDTELQRIHNNGVTEINRRGIPQWK
jgi:hypothetical protein